MRHLLLLSAVLTSCTILFRQLSADDCTEGSPARCDGNVLITCEDGLEAHLDCGGDFCSAALGACDPCGNGVLEPPEECDDGNRTNGDGCSVDCRFELCGNNVVNPPLEQCDDGNLAGGDGCRSNCTTEACGDNIPDIGEQCDDGNNINADTCEADCTLPVCGNGVVDPLLNEQCDDGNLNNGDGCQVDCTFTPTPGCGDGVVVAPEQCDDSNITNGDGCRANCTQELCGDGIKDLQEECDDNNTTNGDGCDSTCQREIVCGDGIFDPPEECDDGDLFSNDGCSSSCQLEADEFVLCGSPVNGDGELATPFNSLASAIASAGTTSGEVVMILPQSAIACQGSGVITKSVTIQGLADVSAPGVPIRPIVDGGANPAIEPNAAGIQVIVRDLFLQSDRNGSTVFQQGTSRVALIRVDVTNPNTGPFTAAVNCSPSAQSGNDGTMLIDQSVLHDVGDGTGRHAFFGDTFCRAVVANSLFRNNLNGAFRVEGSGGNGGDLSVVFSTFDDNQINSFGNEAVLSCDGADPSIVLLDSCVFSNNNSTAPVDLAECSAPTFTNTFGIAIAGTGNINVDPLFTTVNGQGFHLAAGSPSRDTANPAPAPLIFDPVVVFGINVFDHDFNGTPRPANGKDMGMFEE